MARAIDAYGQLFDLQRGTPLAGRPPVVVVVVFVRSLVHSLDHGIQKQIATLRFRLTPMRVKIYYKGRMYELEFEADTTFEQLVETFTKTFKIEPDPGTEFALFEDIDFESDPEKGLLNESDLVASLRKQQPDRNNV